MAERLEPRLRLTGMWMRVLGTLATLLLLAGCGSQASGSAASPSDDPTTSTACRGDGTPWASVDLDGDGTAEDVFFSAPNGDCPAILSGSGTTPESAVTLDWDASASISRGAGVRVPGRTGDLVLILEQHPRGGFQAHLFGYADDKLEELTVDGQPVFPFVATDALTDPLAARCVEGGFEVLQGRRHDPAGVVPAWDVDRTTYTVDGNVVSKGATTEVADNVLEKDFHTKYRALASYSLFANCRVSG